MWQHYVVVDDPKVAEVAVAVAHEDHSLGVGTALIKHVAHVARAHGIKRFVADVLSENHLMLAVLFDLGWCCKPTYYGAVHHIEVELPDVLDTPGWSWPAARDSERWDGCLLGSVTTSLVHHAHCPVAVIHTYNGAAPDPAAPVLLGVDGSPASEAATALAFDEASRRGVELVALHAWSDVGVFPMLGTDWRGQRGQRAGDPCRAPRWLARTSITTDVELLRRVLCCD